MAGTREIAQRNGRKGGRPKGSTTKPRISDYITEEEVSELIETAKSKAREGDMKMLTLILEHIFGKAPQAMELTGKDGESLFTFDDEQINKIAERIAKRGGSNGDTPSEK